MRQYIKSIGVMAAKMVIHKIEDEINFKSLQISLEHNENGKHEAVWVEGKIEVKSKDKRFDDVVVKVVTAEETSILDLDYCARKIVEGSILDLFEDYFSKDCEKQSCNDKTSSENPLKRHGTEQTKKGLEIVPLSTLSKDNISDNNNEINEFENFLEDKLVKVKENNSRILEKIQILNGTLNFITTKTFYCEGTNAKAPHTCSECEKCFVYETGLRRHVQLRHGNIDGPRWQTVWKCTECFQVWPRYDAAMRHGETCCSPTNSHIAKEIKTSLLLQCEFCEKVFTCIPKLLRHYKDHTVKYNYECKGCCMIFISFKSAAQHWTQCVWLKENYTFSLPKMLLCNICDRKFKNYEQLYIHRYKQGHFMRKSLEKENLLNLVYQCEVCGQWFVETTLLEEHRNQKHPRFDCVVTL